MLRPRQAVCGDNTDGVGLVRDLTRNLGRRARGRARPADGRGRRGAGVLAPLLAGRRRSAPHRQPHGARAPRALARARSRASQACGYEALAGAAFDLVINATSAGLAGRAAAAAGGAVRAGALAYDMVYGRDTPFLAMARAAGAATSDGLGMLVEQAAESFLRLARRAARDRAGAGGAARR